jgi:hypothetical protein
LYANRALMRFSSSCLVPALTLKLISPPDTFCQARHVKCDENRQDLIQDVIEQVQAQLEETQITTVVTMNDTDPTIPLGHYAQMDDPDVRACFLNQICCNLATF